MIQIGDILGCCFITAIVTSIGSYVLGRAHGRLEEIDKANLKAQEVSQ